MLGFGPIASAPIAALPSTDDEDVITGTLNATLEPLTADLSGTIIPPIVGTLNATLEPLTADLSGTILIGPLEYYTDFSEYSTSEQPADWTHRQGNSSSRDVVAVGGATGGQVVRISGNGSAGTPDFLSWDDVPHLGDCDIVLRVKRNQNSQLGVGVVWRGGAGGYWLEHRGDVLGGTSNALRLYRNSGSTTVLATTAAGSFDDPEDYFWMRVVDTGGVIQAKMWSGTREDEPGAWALEYDDSAHSNADNFGYVGIVRSRTNGSAFISADFDIFQAEGDEIVGADTLAAELVDDGRAIEITITETDAGVTGRTLHRGTSPEFTVGAGNEIADLGPDPAATYLDDTARPSTTYYYVTVVTDGDFENTSNEVSATTIDSLLEVAYVTDDEAGLVFSGEEDALAVQYQLILEEGDWESPILDATKTDDSMTFLVAAGLTNATDYTARARQRFADGTWGDWWYAWFTTAGAPDYVDIGEFTAPQDGAIVTGTITLTWDLDWYERESGWVPTSLEVSVDGGGWTVLQSGIQLPSSNLGSYQYDTSVNPDGFLIFRLEAQNVGRGEEGETFLTLWMNNDGTLDTVENGVTTDDFDDAVFSGTKRTHSNHFVDEYDEPMFGGSGEDNDGAVVVWGETAFQTKAYLEDATIAGDDVPTGFYAYASAAAIAAGLSRYWWFNLQIEGAFVAIDALDQFGEVICTAQTRIGNVWPIYPCRNANNLFGSSSGFLRFPAYRGTAFTAHQYTHSAKGGWPGACPVKPRNFAIMMRMELVNPADPNTFDITFASAGASTQDVLPSWSNKSFTTRHTFGQTAEGEDVCLAGFRWRMGPGPYSSPGFVAGTGFGFTFLDPVTACDPVLIETEPPVEPPEPECPEFPPWEDPPLPSTPGQPCTVILQVFEADRQTVAWEVGTDPDHPNPYLVEPSHYGEQEADFTQGSASIGQVNIVVIDPPRTPGDQDTGWATEKLAAGLRRNAWGGRRHRLLRWTSAEQGWVVIADGPGGFPRMESDYASFEGSVRDTRESERKTEIFVARPNDTDPCRNPTPYTTIMPRGVAADWGDVFQGDPDLAGVEYILPAVTPASGTHEEGGEGLVSFRHGYLQMPPRLEFDPVSTAPEWMVYSEGLAQVAEATVIEPTGETATETDEDGAGRRAKPRNLEDHAPGSFDVYTLRWPHLELWWRYPGIDPDTGLAYLWNREQIVRSGVTSWNSTNLFAHHLHRKRVQVALDENGNPVLETRDVVKGIPLFEPLGTYSEVEEPPYGTDLEFMLVHVGEPSEDAPMLIEATAGELLRDLYDGHYSARQEDGSVLWSGVRYDREALDAMTEPVRLIVTEAADDLREWAQKHIYKPLGYVPALDADGQVSPVHQDPTEAFTSLTPLTDASIEPSPEWSAGDKIVNHLEFRYPRTFVWDEEIVPDPDLEHSSFSTLVRKPREVHIVFRNDQSSLANREQRWECDAQAFVALAYWDSDPVHSLDEEYGHRLAAARKVRVFDRLKWGSPLTTQTCLRSETWDWRVGTWVRIQPSWLPDYITDERGADYYAQVIGIRDLDCVWRQITFELAAEELVAGTPELTTSSRVGAGGGVSVDGTHAALQAESTTSRVGAGGGPSSTVTAGAATPIEATTSSTVGAGPGASNA